MIALIYEMSMIYEKLPFIVIKYCEGRSSTHCDHSNTWVADSGWHFSQIPIMNWPVTLWRGIALKLKFIVMICLQIGFLQCVLPVLVIRILAVIL